MTRHWFIAEHNPRLCTPPQALLGVPDRSPTRLARRDAARRGQLCRPASLGPPLDNTVRALGERCKPSTINAIVAAVTAFRVYHVRAGTMAEQIDYQLQIVPGQPYKSFLHHVTKGRPIPTRIIKIKSHAPCRGH
jgi:hypothetical protein